MINMRKMRRRQISDQNDIKQEKNKSQKKPIGMPRSPKQQEYYDTDGPEEWRILDIDPTVKVSSWGRVKRRGKLSHLKCDKEGYQRITLKGKSYRLHRIILNAFEPCPGDEYVIDHINNIHNDNRISNLRWVTVQENSKFAGEMGLQSRIYNSNNIVICIDKETNTGYMFNTVAELCKYFTKLNTTEVSAYLVGKRKSLKGYNVVRVNGLEDMRDKNR